MEKNHPAYGQIYSQMLSAELEKHTMSWDNILKEWYPIAVACIEFSSVAEMQISGGVNYEKLFKQEKQGLNMNVVMALANNVETVKAKEFNEMVCTTNYREFIALNNKVGVLWDAQADPVRKMVAKKVAELEMQKPALPVKPMIVVPRGSV